MKFRLLSVLLLMILIAPAAIAQKSKNAKRGNDEKTLINKLEVCLSNKDPYCQMALWPDIDTLSKIVLMVSDSSSIDFKEAMAVQDNPVMMMHADSMFKARLKAGFDSVIQAGEALGVHWESIIPVRHELIKMRQTRDQLYEKLAPTRFVGYLFFVDAVTRRSYGVLAGDVMEINGAWYGGRVREIYEANSRDEWDDAKLFAKKHPDKADSIKKSNQVDATEAQQEVNAKAPKVIAERKYYVGKFDDEISVQLYIRGLRGGCPAGVCSWEAIYKFGDQDDFIRLEVTHLDNGKWQMIETPPAGSMDLELKERVFTGIWNAADGQTGYDVKLTETDATPKKLARLDEIFAELEGKK
jgi:hypothetical protein